MNEFEQALAILTKQAARLVQAAPHCIPGEAKLMLTALEDYAMKLTESRLIGIAQLDQFFDVTHIVTHNNLAMVCLIGPVEQERILYLQRGAAEYRAQQAVTATV